MAREFEEDRGYDHARQESIAELDLSTIDGPITDIVEKLNEPPCCYTLQSCWGHFLWLPGQGHQNIEPIPSGFSGPVTYRIAYLALCLENSSCGKSLLRALAGLPAVAPDFIRLGSADWFWKRWTNSYVLQVVPEGHLYEDEAVLEPEAARQTQTARDLFFKELRVVLAAELDDQGGQCD